MLLRTIYNALFEPDPPKNDKNSIPKPNKKKQPQKKSLTEKEIKNEAYKKLLKKQQTREKVTQIRESLQLAKKDKKKISELEKMLKNTNSRKYIDLHSAYSFLHKHYYRLRDKKWRADKKAIHYCLKDIELFPKYKKAYIEQAKERKMIELYLNDSLTLLELDKKKIEIKNDDEDKYFDRNISSFKQLVLLYEGKSEWKKAIEICHLALSYNLTDGTKYGYEGRIKKLEKKLNSDSKKTTNS